MDAARPAPQAHCNYTPADYTEMKARYDAWVAHEQAQPHNYTKGETEAWHNMLLARAKAHCNFTEASARARITAAVAITT